MGKFTEVCKLITRQNGEIYRSLQAYYSTEWGNLPKFASLLLDRMGKFTEVCKLITRRNGEILGFHCLGF